MINRALNQKTAPHLSYEDFMDLAQKTGCMGVEPRNDLARGLFDGIPPKEAGAIARAMGLRLVGMCEVYPFNDWSDDRARAIEALIDAAVRSGAESISLIPRTDGVEVEDGVRQPALRRVLREVLPMIEGRNIIALVEPVGFAASSLRSKAELVDAIEAVGGKAKFKLVHDTFQHAIAGGGELFPEYTATVHVSGISDPYPVLDEKLDGMRMLVDENDRCGTVEQIAGLLSAGYEGSFSMECTSPLVQKSQTLIDDIRRSFEFIEKAVARSS